MYTRISASIVKVATIVLTLAKEKKWQLLEFQ
jgi:hypothetical protein